MLYNYINFVFFKKLKYSDLMKMNLFFFKNNSNLFFMKLNKILMITYNSKSLKLVFISLDKFINLNYIYVLSLHTLVIMMLLLMLLVC